MKNGSIFLILLLLGLCAHAQNKVTGVVKDSSDRPLTGVSVSVNGRGATLTDIEGKFTVSAAPGAMLLFSYTGFKPQEVRYNGQSQLTISLEGTLKILDEAVVIGYGTTRKRDLTGSVATVKPEALQKFPTANVSDMLRGQAPGVLVTSNTTSPGGGATIRIRGNRSLSSNQSPLFLVDGMIVPQIDDLNANDIESIDILKDASSQAIYGSRAANGVILVTTKRGKPGKVNVDVSSYASIQNAHRNFDLYNPDEFVTLRYWAKLNDGVGNLGTLKDPNYKVILDDQIMLDSYTSRNFVDWEKLMIKNALQNDNNISIRGGSDKVRYSFNMGYFNQNGVVDRSGYIRPSTRLNLDFNVAKWLNMGVNVSYSRPRTQLNDGSRFSQILTVPTLAKAYDDNGNLLREISTSGTVNPLWYNREYKSEQTDEYQVVSGFANFKPFAGFSYKLTGNLRSNNRETDAYKTKQYPGSTGDGSITGYKRSSYLIENLVNYAVPMPWKSHNLNLTLIQSFEQDLQKTTGFSFIKSPSDEFEWNFAGDAEINGVTRSIVRTHAVSFAGRLQYSLMDKYLLTASVRRDGASVFGADNKWATMPSVALAWKINNESFLKNATWIDLLKLRVSYGKVGNWAIPAYRTLGLSTSYEYILGSAADLNIGYLPSSELLNQSLKWETTGSYNFGADFVAFNNRLSATLEYYRTTTNDLLVKRTVPSITGYTSTWDNLGKTQSTGWEFSLNGTIIQKHDLQWNLGGSISTQKNKIIKIDGRVDDKGNPVNDLNNGWFIGKSINVAYNYVFGGIWQEGETPNANQYLAGDAVPTPGSIRVKDYNGDGKITTDDRKIYNLDPSWYATINSSLSYKNLDMNVEFYTVQNVIKNNPYYYDFNYGGSLNAKLNGIKVNYWTPDNKSNEAPKPQYTASTPYFNLLGYRDASYFRLRSATLGYTIPKKLTSRWHMERLRFYLTGTNIFTQTKYKSYSPEKEPSAYPETRNLTFGMNLSF
ncbi:MAG: TonB-dependent receptor [Bacteroidetes bacterium]|nr:TonB-dependent receptor [Bacteroidota bacterium]